MRVDRKLRQDSSPCGFQQACAFAYRYVLRNVSNYSSPCFMKQHPDVPRRSSDFWLGIRALAVEDPVLVRYLTVNMSRCMYCTYLQVLWSWYLISTREARLWGRHQQFKGTISKTMFTLGSFFIAIERSLLQQISPRFPEASVPLHCTCFRWLQTRCRKSSCMDMYPSPRPC